MKRTLLIALTFTTMVSYGQLTVKQTGGKNSPVQFNNNTIQTNCGYTQNGNNLENGWLSNYTGNTINSETADAIDIPANETWVIVSATTYHFTNITPTEIWMNFYTDSIGSFPSSTLVDSVKTSNITSTIVGNNFNLDVHEVVVPFTSGNVILTGDTNGTRYWMSAMNNASAASYWEFREDSNYNNVPLVRRDGTGPWGQEITFFSARFTLNYYILGGASNDTLCYGDSLLIAGEYQDTTGTYNDTLQNINGCDSVVTVNLFVHSPLNVTLSSFTQDTMCVFWAPMALPGASPTGGTYSGPGVSDTTFDPNAAGVGTHTIVYSYTDTVTGCTEMDSTLVHVEACTGIGENSLSKQVKVFPNPVAGMLNINADINIHSVEILDLLGKQLVLVNANNASNLQVDMTGLSKGQYFVRINTNKGTVTQKLIK